MNWQCGRFWLDETTLLRLIAASLPLPLVCTRHFHADQGKTARQAPAKSG